MTGESGISMVTDHVSEPRAEMGIGLPAILFLRHVETLRTKDHSW